MRPRWSQRLAMLEPSGAAGILPLGWAWFRGRRRPEAKPRPLGITKRGSRYLRKNLIQGARASLPTMSKSDSRLGAWLRSLLLRSHPNTVVVAVAAKMARMVWPLLRHQHTYDPVAQAA